MTGTEKLAKWMGWERMGPPPPWVWALTFDVLRQNIDEVTS